ncbi:hypothetical protein JOE48_005494 [Methylobacterium sp. PvR107]|nr:hypothetical protein [Methylobacterium sp. PvR107]
MEAVKRAMKPDSDFGVAARRHLPSPSDESLARGRLYPPSGP